VHFLGANLDFEGLAAVQNGSVQRLVEIGPGHGYVILEAAGDRAPDVVHDTKAA